MRPGGNPGFAVDAGGDEHRKLCRIGERLDQIGPPPYSNGRTLDQRRNPGGAGAVEFRAHEGDHGGGIGFGKAGRFPGTQIDKKMFVGQDHPQFSRRARSKRSDQVRHG